MQKNTVLLAVAFMGFAIQAAAQPANDRSQLEKERNELQKEMKEIQGMYDRVKGQKKQTLGQLNVLIRKINLQEQYINSINKELKSIDDDIYLSNLEIYRLQKQVDTLKAQYARTVVYAYKNRSNYDYLNFIFSASSFNDAIRRINYLKSYRAYREKQVNTILETQQLIAQRQQQQLGRKTQKNVALNNQTKQVQELEVQKKEKDVVVSQLKSKEKELTSQIAERKKRDAKLKSAIFAIIERERVKALEEEKKRLAALEAERKRNAAVPGPKTNPVEGGTVKVNTPAETKKPAEKAAPAPKTYVILNAEETKLAASFTANRGKLPWPVDNGVVCSNFGTNKIEGTLLTEDNPGITICIPSAGVAVKSVFDGEVLSVFNLGDGMSVMIKHGNFYTIYSNLSSVSVSKDAVVRTGQAIGRAGNDDDGNGGKIDFMLMQDKKNVNPRPWLR
ncbi:MAG: peptidoglycan DD-metalloendopeptidase family protein [Bacteroidetes bacterium]|nr:peptidoglycan DD-metalloendopeptidase family protein [Bacteroidota bacterium]